MDDIHQDCGVEKDGSEEGSLGVDVVGGRAVEKLPDIGGLRLALVRLLGFKCGGFVHKVSIAAIVARVCNRQRIHRTLANFIVYYLI